MRTANICPTCTNFTNALCSLYNGPFLETLNILNTDSVEVALQRIETWASQNGGNASGNIFTTDGNIEQTRVVTVLPDNTLTFSGTSTTTLTIGTGNFNVVTNGGDILLSNTGNSIDMTEGSILEIKAFNGIRIRPGSSGSAVPSVIGQVLTAIDSQGTSKFETQSYDKTGYTVATLPSSPEMGDRTYVTDSVSLVFGQVVSGGGANVMPVFFNGTNWIIA